MHPHTKEGGLSLIELMTTIAVMVILMGVATHNWQGLIERQQGRALKTQLRTAFQFARFGAITHNQQVTMCPLNSANQCTSSWNGPISVFLDPGNQKSLTSPQYLLRTFAPNQNGYLKASNSGIYERRYFQFSPDGTAHGTIGNLTWCPSSKNAQRGFQVILNFGGRIRWAKDTNNDGIVENSNQLPITCA